MRVHREIECLSTHKHQTTISDTSTTKVTSVPHQADCSVLWKLRVIPRCAILYSYSTFWEHTLFLHGNWLVSLLISCL